MCVSVCVRVGVGVGVAGVCVCVLESMNLLVESHLELLHWPRLCAQNKEYDFGVTCSECKIKVKLQRNILKDWIKHTNSIRLINFCQKMWTRKTDKNIKLTNIATISTGCKKKSVWCRYSSTPDLKNYYSTLNLMPCCADYVEIGKKYSKTESRLTLQPKQSAEQMITESETDAGLISHNPHIINDPLWQHYPNLFQWETYGNLS